MIQVLSEETIDKIAAGEVVERPASCVKELCENAIDAGAAMISVEIKDGGMELIRVTDNGCGIDKDELRTAFLRHATSKITEIEDLNTLKSLGFRGEALSSISAVSRTEVITRTQASITAARYRIEGSREIALEEVGAPVGTTFLVRDLFFNTPVRRKFLKSAATEGAYVADVLEHLAMSHPEVAFTFKNGSRTPLQTSGRNDLKEVIYRIYGRDITKELLEINQPSVSGYIAKPSVARSNRSFEQFFVNGRYVKSQLLSKAVEEAYSPFLMQHKFPFCIIHLNLAGSDVDANVHPQKMEVRFSDNERIYNYVMEVVREALRERELIPEVSFSNDKAADGVVPYRADIKNTKSDNASEEFIFDEKPINEKPINEKPINEKPLKPALPFEEKSVLRERAVFDAKVSKDSDLKQLLVKDNQDESKQMNLFEDKLMTKSARDEFKILGQAFLTYWIVEYKEKLMFLDQHAAHEKVLYERFSAQIKANGVFSQQIYPPVIVSLNTLQKTVFNQSLESFTELGFEIEEFGGSEYALRAVPENFASVDSKELFLEILDGLCENDSGKTSSDILKDRIATKACKAAVKGNNKLSVMEVEALLDELLQLENPYNCPHGRPTMFTLTKYELEKKFKRIV